MNKMLNYLEHLSMMFPEQLLIINTLKLNPKILNNNKLMRSFLKILYIKSNGKKEQMDLCLLQVTLILSF